MFERVFFFNAGWPIGLAVPNLMNTGMLKVVVISSTIINLAALWVDKCPQGRAAFKRRMALAETSCYVVDWPFS